MYLCYLSGGGVDYGPLPMECTPLFFFSLDSQQCCGIPITDDALTEDTESFNVTLTTTESADDANLIDPTLATVFITDNDGEFADILLSIASSPPFNPLFLV